MSDDEDPPGLRSIRKEAAGRHVRRIGEAVLLRLVAQVRKAYFGLLQLFTQQKYARGVSAVDASWLQMHPAFNPSPPR